MVMVEVVKRLEIIEGRRPRVWLSRPTRLGLGLVGVTRLWLGLDLC